MVVVILTHSTIGPENALIGRPLASFSEGVAFQTRIQGLYLTHDNYVICLTLIPLAEKGFRVGISKSNYEKSISVTTE